MENENNTTTTTSWTTHKSVEAQFARLLSFAQMLNGRLSPFLEALHLSALRFHGDGRHHQMQVLPDESECLRFLDARIALHSHVIEPVIARNADLVNAVHGFDRLRH